MKADDFLYFAEELEEIVPRIIPTSFGDIYSSTAGVPGQPLILVVHGSGPKNSADQYAYLLHEYLVRVSYLEKFYIVAVDCPGYGRSKGSKEAVKTFPLQMFREILASLKYRNYFAMLGHSQGGAAIFNAVHEDPSLSEFLVMDRPVCGSIQRFRNFLMPTLLIYDIEDDGHPLWQGKLLYKELKSAQLYTYRDSVHPCWVPDHIWDLMMSFFSSLQKKQRKAHFAIDGEKRNYSCSNSKSKSKSVSKGKNQRRNIVSAGRIVEIKKEEARGLKLLEIQQIERSELMSLSSRDPGQSQSLEEKPDFRLPHNFDSSSSNRQSNCEGERKIPANPSKKIQQAIPAPTEERAAPSPEKQSLKKPAISAEQLQQQHKCAICYELLYRPVVTNCSHTFCNKCLLQSLLVNEKCPLCRGKIIKKTEDKDLHRKIIIQLSEKQLSRRENEFQKVERMLRSIVYVQIGNTSKLLETKQSAFTKTKKKYIWQLFVKPSPNFPLEEVTFNINMGDSASKPVRVRNAPFTFESRSTFSFACEIGIKPRNKEYGEMMEIYRIDIEPGYHSRKVALRKKCYLKA